MSKEKAILKLKEGLAKFKEDATKTGWEEDEVDEKVAEVFENFPWYQFNAKIKRTWKSKLWNICLYSFIIYLAVGAVLQRNKRMRKNINDYIFDLEIPYQQNRIFRYLTLPIFKFYDLSKFHSTECLVYNPFLEKEALKCEFCENIQSISVIHNDYDKAMDKITNNEIFIIHDIDGYFQYNIGFNDVRNLFLKHGKYMDERICKIFLTKQFTKVSNYFKLSEEEVNEKNISIAWRNCDAYGTRYYRMLFPRPSFISNMSEIMLEKDMYFLQPGQNITIDRISGETTYIYQVQGKTVYSFLTPDVCHSECAKIPLHVEMIAGEILLYPNADWLMSVKSVGGTLTILYLSAFDS